MAKITKAVLEATLAARDAEIVDLRAKLKAAQRHISALESSATQDMRDRSSVSAMRQVMDRCKQLAAQGVPCKIHRGVLVHSVTLAPLS